MKSAEYVAARAKRNITALHEVCGSYLNAWLQGRR